MSIGHYIRLGDRTTCGGVVLEGNPSFTMHGVPVARSGDAVTCGKDGKHYLIAGGFESFMIGGAVAGTLDSVSTCPCRARLIHSLSSATYQSRQDAATLGEFAAGVAPSSHVAAASVGTARIFAKSFVITDSNTGKPLANRKYIALVDGCRKVGVTDSNGMAIVEAPVEGAVIRVHVIFHAPARELAEFSEMFV